METTNKKYLKLAQREGTHFQMIDDNTFESITIAEYNDRKGTNHASFDDVNDDDIWSSDEVASHIEDIDAIKFV